MTEDNDKKPSEDATGKTDNAKPEAEADWTDADLTGHPEGEGVAEDAAAPGEQEGEPLIVEPDPLVVLEEENGILKDRLMRTLADLENTRKRAQRDKEDALKFGMQKFARDMCEVADNLQRALDATDPEAASDETKSVLEGVTITRDSLKQIFERHGVTEIEAKDQKFDPNLHEAMTEIDVPGAPPGVCIDVIERGYTLQGRLLRPARVIVTKAQSAAGSKVDTKV